MSLLIVLSELVLNLDLRALSDMMSQYRGSKSRSSLEASTPRASQDDDDATRASVLPSSTELFYFYAQVLDQCSDLFTGQPLFDLCNLYKRWLRIYAGMLFMFFDSIVG